MIDVAVVAQPNKVDGRVDAQPLYRERFVVGSPLGTDPAPERGADSRSRRGELLSRMDMRVRDHIRASANRRA